MERYGCQWYHFCSEQMQPVASFCYIWPWENEPSNQQVVEHWDLAHVFNSKCITQPMYHSINNFINILFTGGPASIWLQVAPEHMHLWWCQLPSKYVFSSHHLSEVNKSSLYLVNASHNMLYIEWGNIPAINEVSVCLSCTQLFRT